MADTGSENTRQRLLDAARELFMTRGFNATSTRAIAAQAGCNLSLIKYYFGSKEGLLREMLRDRYTEIGADVRQRVEVDGPASERIPLLIRTLGDQIDRNRDMLRMMIRELATEDSPVATEVAELVRIVQHPIIGMLAESIRLGQVRAIDPRFAGVALVGMLGFYHLAYPVTSVLVGPRDEATLDRLREAVTEIFLHGILEPAPSEKETRP